MKIKASSEKADILSLCKVFPFVALAAVVLRSVQILKLIDAETGFYTQKSFITVLFHIIVFGSCLAFCVISFLSKSASKLTVNNLKSKPLWVVTVIFAVFMLFDALSAFVSSVSAASEQSNEYIETTLFKELMGSGSIAGFFQSIAALLSAIYLFYLASSFKSGSEKAAKHKILALTPVAWVSFRMIGLFVSKISFLSVSDLFLELVMLAFMILFFMALAQVTSSVYSDGTSWRISAFGLSSALVCAAVSVSRLIFSVIDKETYINSDYPFNAVDLIFFVFAVVLIFEAAKKYETNEVEAETVIGDEVSNSTETDEA